MNIVLLIGNLAADPEKSYTGSGMALTRLRLAVSRLYNKKTEGGGQDADFIRITCFDKQAELVDKYMSKGRKVAVEGRIQTGSYQGKDGNTVYTTDVIANRVEFLDSRRDSDGRSDGFGGQFQDRSESARPEAPGPGAPGPGSEPQIPPDSFAEIDDEDMPF